MRSKTAFFIFLSVVTFSLEFSYAQDRIPTLTNLPDEYHFTIKKDTLEHEVWMVQYEAQNKKKAESGFEIIITSMIPSVMITMDEIIDNIRLATEHYVPELKIQLLQKQIHPESEAKLYHFFSDDGTQVLMLMKQDQEYFTAMEAEFPIEELQYVPIERWQEIFWSWAVNE